MRFMCLVYFEHGAVEAMPPEVMTKLVDDSIEADYRMAASGRLIAAGPLQGINTAVTLRMRDNQLVITDGPFMETKEWLAGFFLIEARDMKDAIEVASKSPPAKGGMIEIRPMLEQRHSVTGVGRPA